MATSSRCETNAHLNCMASYITSSQLHVLPAWPQGVLRVRPAAWVFLGSCGILRDQSRAEVTFCEICGPCEPGSIGAGGSLNRGIGTTEAARYWNKLPCAD